MKSGGEKCLICMLVAFAGLFITAVGWMMWVKTGDPVTTLLAVGLLTVFCFLCPGVRMKKGDESEEISREVEQFIDSVSKQGKTTRRV